MRFISPASPAPDIRVLAFYLRALSSSHSPGHYAYRGQTRAYPGPLLPSMLRRYVTNRDRFFLNPHNLPSFAQRFAPVAFPQTLPDTVEQWLRSEPAEAGGSEPSVQDVLDAAGVTTTLASLLLDQSPGVDREVPKGNKLRAAVDFVHRQMIRTLAAETMFGNPESEFLCQQYGLTSWYLDTTLSIDVAAFFATREAPYYIVPAHDGIGVIYRFQLDDEAAVEQTDASGRPPPALVGERLFAKYEQEGVTFKDAIDGLTDYHLQLHLFDNRDPSLLAVPKGGYAASRVGRQESVMLTPLLTAEQRGDRRVTTGAEDMSARPGCTAFYFRHSPESAEFPELDRSFLWPRIGDVFMQWIQFQLGPQRAGLVTLQADDSLVGVPKRLDLISLGYEFNESTSALLEAASSRSFSTSRLDPKEYHLYRLGRQALEEGRLYEAVGLMLRATALGAHMRSIEEACEALYYTGWTCGILGDRAHDRPLPERIQWVRDGLACLEEVWRVVEWLRLDSKLANATLIARDWAAELLRAMSRDLER